MSDVAQLLDAIELGDPKAANELLPLVQMRYFVGMSVPEIADALNLAPRTVDRHWSFARAWLKRTLRASLSGPAGLAEK